MIFLYFLGKIDNFEHKNKKKKLESLTLIGFEKAILKIAHFSRIFRLFSKIRTVTSIFCYQNYIISYKWITIVVDF